MWLLQKKKNVCKCKKKSVSVNKKINPWQIKDPKVHSNWTIFHLVIFWCFKRDEMAHNGISYIAFFHCGQHYVFWAIYTNWMCIKQARLGWIETLENYLNCGSESWLSHSLVYCRLECFHVDCDWDHAGWPVESLKQWGKCRQHISKPFLKATTVIIRKGRAERKPTF